MAYELTKVDEQKRSVVGGFFIDTADDNYVTARWCFLEWLNVDYYWLAVHALEKYMKAALLLNGFSSTSYGHDISKLYGVVKQFASELLPKEFEKPDWPEVDSWVDEKYEDFLSRLYDKGKADNRYQIYGYEKEADDLVKLDMTVFSLRRLCVPLDAYAIRGEELTCRELLSHNPGDWDLSPGLNLEEIAKGHRGRRLSEVLFNENPNFAGREIPDSLVTGKVMGINSILDHYILEPIGKYHGSEKANEAVQLGKWVIDNIHIPKNEKAKIERAISGQRT